MTNRSTNKSWEEGRRKLCYWSKLCKISSNPTLTVFHIDNGMQESKLIQIWTQKGLLLIWELIKILALLSAEMDTIVSLGWIKWGHQAERATKDFQPLLELVLLYNWQHSFIIVYPNITNYIKRATTLLIMWNLKVWISLMSIGRKE